MDTSTIPPPPTASELRKQLRAAEHALLDFEDDFGELDQVGPEDQAIHALRVSEQRETINLLTHRLAAAVKRETDITTKGSQS